MKRRIAISVLVAGLSVTAQPMRAADPVSDGQWFHQFLDTAQAHQISDGSALTVAVIDTGVDAKHPDLAGSVLPGRDMTGIQSSGSIDNNGHGTAMASLIAAHGRVKGIAPAAKILPIGVGTDEGRSGLIASGIRWAVGQGAKVISISLGSDQQSDHLRQEVMAAMAADVVIVASAGNRPEDTGVIDPAAIQGVVAVGGVDKAGNHSSKSVSGAQMVITAPSDEISGATVNGNYRLSSGTSNSAAIVAGAVALIRSKFPQIKAPEVVRRLTATATDKGAPGRDPEYGFGVLNLVGALTADIPASPPPSTPSSPSGFPWRPTVLLAIPCAAIVVVGIVIGAVLWSRRRRHSTQPHP